MTFLLRPMVSIYARTSTGQVCHVNVHWELQPRSMINVPGVSGTISMCFQVSVSLIFAVETEHDQEDDLNIFGVHMYIAPRHLGDHFKCLEVLRESPQNRFFRCSIRRRCMNPITPMITHGPAPVESLDCLDGMEFLVYPGLDPKARLLQCSLWS